MSTSDGQPDRHLELVTPAAGPVVRTIRTASVFVIFVLVVLIMGGLGAGGLLISRLVEKSGEPVPLEPAEDTRITEATDPPLTLPPGDAAPGATPTAIFLTPVANPRVRVPINDVRTAADAVRAKVGRRQLVASSIYLYSDGRITFDLQAPEEPTGVDRLTWSAGVIGPATPGNTAVSVSRLFPVADLDLARLAALCDAAITATGIADGTIDVIYLANVGGSLRWYILVQSQARASTNKTYRVAPDGTNPEVF